MEILQWTTFICSLIFGIGWLLAAAFLTIVLFAVSRPSGVIVGSISLGFASFAHMIMVPIQHEIGIPGSLYAKYLVRGISFEDIVTGRLVYFEIGVAIVGIISAIIGGYYLSHRIRHLIGQIENIPTSKARSAAIGLAEFKGVVGSVSDVLPVETDGNLKYVKYLPEEYVLSTETLCVNSENEPGYLNKQSAFYLEDETGNILIDPRGVIFSDAYGLGLIPFLFKSTQAIDLTLNFEFTKGGEQLFLKNRGKRRFLKAGDPVYAIGSVQINKNAPPDAIDSERLVVRPDIRYASRNKITGSPLFSGAIDNIFFLSDDADVNLTSGLRRWMRGFLKAALVLLVISVLYLGYYLRVI